MSSFSCSSPATRQYEGKWWCFHHDPREKEKKLKARNEKWKLEQQEDDHTKRTGIQLLRRLGVVGYIDTHKFRYVEQVRISFSQIVKLLKELGK